MSEVAATPLPNLWDDALATGLDEAGQLLYRSNLLGADLRITNFGGGNTSAKLSGTDPLTGETVEVLWVKGSGGDLGLAQHDADDRMDKDDQNDQGGQGAQNAQNDESDDQDEHGEHDERPGKGSKAGRDKRRG